MRRAAALWVCVAIAASPACKRREPPPAADTPVTVTVTAASADLLLTWIDDKGDFHVEQKVADVPLVGRDAVRVVDPTKDEGTHGDVVFVADLRNAKPDGTFSVRAMPRSEFEAIAVARRQKNAPTLASASAPKNEPASPGAAEPTPAGRPAVIIYGASWCSACHDAAAWLRKRGIAFVEKDIEADEKAAQEMRSKLTRAGLRGGSIPVIDVRGRLMVGFNAREVESALGQPL